MAEKKRTKSTFQEEPEKAGFNFSCCNPEEIFKMMQNFCNGKNVNSDCSEMMSKGCCEKSEQKEKKS